MRTYRFENRSTVTVKLLLVAIDLSGFSGLMRKVVAKVVADYGAVHTALQV